MSQWGPRGVTKCHKCNITRLDAALKDGVCVDVEWCNKQRVIPEAISQQWARISEDLAAMGSAGFEVDGKKYVLYGIQDTASLWAEQLEEAPNE